MFTGDGGTWCAVRMQPDEHGVREVRERASTTIWCAFEATYAEWEGAFFAWTSGGIGSG